MERRAVAASDNDMASHLHENENKSLLRFLTCGSVDDGKSTLIGRLLYDSKLILEDHLAELERGGRDRRSAGSNIDFALLMDGLEAEREQGITIDVAYRFFATDRRKFIVADAPGHEEYTRNMATAASTAELAIVLVDIRHGVLQQTRRHSTIASLLGIRHIVLAVNKIDLVGYEGDVFDRIVADYTEFAGKLGFATIQAIPISARDGDNITRPSENTPWYGGPNLLAHLETVTISGGHDEKPFRFPVQYVSRPDPNFRGFAGQVASGSVAPGDAITVAKSGQSSRVKQIVSFDGILSRAVEGQAVTLLLEDELDVSRGNMLVSPASRPQVSDRFQAHVIWFDPEPMMQGRSYVLRTETDSVSAQVTTIESNIDVNTFAQAAARRLGMNEIGVCNFFAQMPIAFDPYAENRITGNFILIDRLTNRTVGAGMIDHALDRAENVHHQALEIDRNARAALMNQRPAVIWFTGLPGSGKSTIANALEKLLHACGRHTYMLDGDNVRRGLNSDLGFTNEDRVESIRRVAEVAKLMADAGLIVLASFISPFRSERRFARDLVAAGDFIEVFVDTPIDECIRRDPKGLYRKALDGELENFTGVSSPYETPENPELRLETIGADPADLAARIADLLSRRP